MKRICITLLVALFILSSFTFALASEVPVGDGSAENPIIITDAAGLAAIKENLSACYVINADIDLTGTDWEPIGDADEPFTGTIDGKGHIINGLNVSESAGGDYYAGLFGVTKGATIKSIRMKATRISVTGASASEWAGLSAGALVGKAINTVIENCYNTGNISVTAEVSMVTAGGLVGEMNGNSSVKKSFNTGKVTTSSAGNLSLAGGICGAVDGGSIENCYNAGSISSSAFNATYAYAGGIAGEISSAENPSSIKTSYNAGDVTSLRESGNPDVDNAYFGSFGIVASSLHSGIENCYSINTADRCVGYLTAGDTLESTTHEISEDTNALLTPEEMMELGSFEGFIAEVWEISFDTEYSYPMLAGIPHDSVRILTMELSEAPTEITCAGENNIDFVGGKIKVNYDDNASEEFYLADEYITMVDYDAPSLTVIYKGQDMIISVNEISHDYIETPNPPTCTEDGYTDMVCQRCGHTFIKDYEESPGHSHELIYNSGEGIYIKSCSVCGDSEELGLDDAVAYFSGEIKKMYNRDEELSYKDKSSFMQLRGVYEASVYNLSVNLDEVAQLEYKYLYNRFDLYSRGDIDMDGIVKAKDLSRLLFYYGKSDEAASIANITGTDDFVDSYDLSQLLTNYGIRLQQLMNRN